MKTHRRATITTALVLAVVFTAGTLVGRAWSDHTDRDLAVAAEPEGGDAGGSDGRGSRERRMPMYEQVGIDDVQRVAIDSIVVHYRTGVRTLQEEARGAYEARYKVLVDSAREAIKSVMTPEQTIEYDSLLQASDERWRERKIEREEGEDGWNR